jgi:hypothetical protein
MPQVDHVHQLHKHRCSSFPKKEEQSTEHLLDLVHGDLCGPIKPTTPGGKKMFLLMVNDFRRFMWLVLL